MKVRNDIPRVNYVIALICAIGILVNLFSGHFDMMTNSMLFLGLLLITPAGEEKEKPTQKAKD